MAEQAIDPECRTCLDLPSYEQAVDYAESKVNTFDDMEFPCNLEFESLQWGDQLKAVVAKARFNLNNQEGWTAQCPGKNEDGSCGLGEERHRLASSPK